MANGDTATTGASGQVDEGRLLKDGKFLTLNELKQRVKGLSTAEKLKFGQGSKRTFRVNVDGENPVFADNRSIANERLRELEGGQRSQARFDEAVGVLRDQQGFSNEIAGGLLDIQGQSLDLARERFAAEARSLDSSREIAEARWADWNEIYAPIERDVVQDATIGRDPEFAAGRARAAVAQQFERSREAGVRRLAQSGITPSSPTGQQFLRGLDIGEAATRAGEANRAREGVIAQNQNRKVGALQLGLGLPGQVAGINSGISSQAGAQASGLLGLGGQLGSNAAGLGQSAAAGLAGGLQNLGNLNFNLTQRDFERGQGLQSAFNAQQSSPFGISNILGGIGGFATGGITGGLAGLAGVA